MINSKTNCNIIFQQRLRSNKNPTSTQDNKNRKPILLFIRLKSRAEVYQQVPNDKRLENPL